MVRELMPNGLFVSYKRGGRRRQKSSRVGRTKCCRTGSELLSLSLLLLSLCIFCSIAYLCRFRGGSRCSWNALSASCSTSDLFSCFCASCHTGIGICSPPCPFSLVPISCPTEGCNILPLFSCLLVFTIYIYIFVVASICVGVVRIVCVEGTCPCV